MTIKTSAKILLLIIGVIASIAIVPVFWSGHILELRTPRSCFSECYGVNLPKKSSTLHLDKREGAEFLLIWKCEQEFINHLESNPPIGYEVNQWEKIKEELHRLLNRDEFPDLIIIKTTKHRRSRILGIDKKSGFVLGSSIG